MISQVSKHGSLIFCREKLDHGMKVCVCVGGGVLTTFYRQQAPIHEKGMEPCIKGRPSLKTRYNQPWVLTVVQNEYMIFFDYMLIIHLEMSL